MGWFEEQLKYRKDIDDRNFEEALKEISSAVVGKRLKEALESHELAGSAIDQILDYYHCNYQKEEIPNSLHTVEEQLEYRMRPFGIMRRKVSLEQGWYKDATGAMLGTLKENGDAVALIPNLVYGYSFVNLRSGVKTQLNSKTEKLLDREALCFYKALPMKALKIKDLLIFMAQQYSIMDLLLYFAIMGLSTLLGMLTPVFTKWLTSDVFYSGETSILISLAVFMLAYGVTRMLFSAFQTLVNSKIETKLQMAVEAATMSRILSLPPAFFKEYSPGELSQRTNYMESLCQIIMKSVGNVGIRSIFSLVYVAQIFSYAPALAVAAIGIILTTLLFNYIIIVVQMKVTKKQMLISSQNSGLTYSTISGIQKIKLAGAEKRMFARWARSYSKEAALTYNPPMLLRISGVISLAISLIGTFVLYFLAIQTKLSASDYYAFNSAYGMVSAAFMSLTSLGVMLAQIKPSLDMAKPILEATPEVDEHKQMVNSLAGRIELSNVSFRYSDHMPDVIVHLSLKISPGEFVAIVGSTGCGKSTLVRLLLGFETPQRGSIFYDKYDVSKVDLKSLRKRIGVVMQNGTLFAGDIYSNIVISAPELSLEDAWEAAKMAQLEQDIEAMPMGMYTMISEGQGGVSGGQKQRLMIARALAPKPKILILDEATSALDNITQKAVSQAIDALHCTRIVIAHRLSTIQHADRILYMDNGQITEEGTYEELIALNGRFAELVKRQRLDVDID